MLADLNELLFGITW